MNDDKKYQVTKEDVILLREKTGHGMLDCKMALMKCKGELELSIEYLNNHPVNRNRTFVSYEK